MLIGKFIALENVYSFSSVGQDTLGYIYVSERDLNLHIMISKGEIIDYQGGCGRINRNGYVVDIPFERIYKTLPYAFEFLG